MPSRHSAYHFELKKLHALLTMCVLLSAASAKNFLGRNVFDALPHMMHQDIDFNMEQIFVFSTTNQNWRLYDWNKITTLVECGYHDDEMVQYAHSRNASVVFLADIDPSWLADPALRSSWVKDKVTRVQKAGLDGVNIDFEDVINATDKERREGLTSLVSELVSALKKISPHYQVTADFAWSPNCIDRRCYDYAAIAELSDFVFIMAYDERSQIFGPCIAWANSAINTTWAGLQLHVEAGVAPHKMVLGVPWYGYDYPCIKYNATDYTCELKQVPFRGVDCSDAAGVQIGYSAMTDLVNQSITGRLWDTVAESPYAAYKNSKTGDVHQIWFDDLESLSFKYYMAKWAGLRGVGMWEADSLDYSDIPSKRVLVRDMWRTLPGRLPQR